MRAAVESELSATAKRVVRLADAAGWSTVAVESDFLEDGLRHVCLTVRGRRHGGGRFVVVQVDGGTEAVYWWTREHRAVIKGYRPVESTTKARHGVDVGSKLVHDPELDEVVEWRSERPTPTKVLLSELVGVASRNVPGLLDSEPTQE